MELARKYWSYFRNKWSKPAREEVKDIHTHRCRHCHEDDLPYCGVTTSDDGGMW